MQAFTQMRKEIKSLRKSFKCKQKKGSKKRKYYESSDDSDSNSDSKQDDGCYEHGIMSSEIDNELISSFKNKNQSNRNSVSLSDTKVHSNYSNNITPIKFVDKPLYKEVMKVVKGVGTCSTVVAVPQLIKDGKQTAKRV